MAWVYLAEAAMLGNNRGEDFDLIEDGEVVLRVRYLTKPEPRDCCMCDKPTLSTLSVPYYCGPVRDGQSEGGHAVACEACHRQWLEWSAAERCNCGRWHEPGVIHGMLACYVAPGVGIPQTPKEN